jgi:hypothetical protein
MALRGPAEARQYCRALLEAFSDIDIEFVVDKAFEGGGKIAGEIDFTHDLGCLQQHGVIPALSERAGTSPPPRGMWWALISPCAAQRARRRISDAIAANARDNWVGSGA